MQRKEFNLTLKNSTLIAPDVRHLVLADEGQGEFFFIPGQFLTLFIPTEKKIVRRSFSIANAYNPKSNIIELAASYVPGGIASDFLFDLKPGDQVKATGPFGRLVLRQEPFNRLILMATGTGVTPYRSMLPSLAKLLQTDKELTIHLVFGVRRPQDLLYQAEFLAMVNNHSRFHFHAYYSRTKNLNYVYEQSGYVTQFIDKLTIALADDLFFVCGNPNMIDDVFAKLVAQGVNTARIRREKYISSS